MFTGNRRFIFLIRMLVLLGIVFAPIKTAIGDSVTTNAVQPFIGDPITVQIEAVGAVKAKLVVDREAYETDLVNGKGQMVIYGWTTDLSTELQVSYDGIQYKPTNQWLNLQQQSLGDLDFCWDWYGYYLFRGQDAHYTVSAVPNADTYVLTVHDPDNRENVLYRQILTQPGTFVIPYRVLKNYPYFTLYISARGKGYQSAVHEESCSFCSPNLMKQVTLPAGTKSIGNAAFYNDNGLKYVTIPDGVESIGDYAFHNCDNLMIISVPASVKYIGDNAFNNECGPVHIACQYGTYAWQYAKDYGYCIVEMQ